MLCHNGQFAMTTTREILREKFRLFSKRHAGREKVRCHDGLLVMMTSHSAGAEFDFRISTCRMKRGAMA